MSIKKNTRPSWDAIKKYVEGRLRDERKRTDGRMSKAIEAEQATRAEECSALDEQIEFIAIQVAKHVAALGEGAINCSN